MSEIEEMLNGILSDPKELEKLTGLAKTLSASLGGNPGERSDAPEAAAMRLAARLLQETQESDKSALLNAMKPYLRQERRELIDRAARIARMAGIARLAMSEFPGRRDCINKYLKETGGSPAEYSARPPRSGGGLGGLPDLAGIRSALERRLPFGLDLGDVTVLLILLLLYLDSGDEEFLLLLVILGYQMIRSGR
jgi:hypothetical protein